jgi:ABC-type Fe3+-hydroxamate transport system substrate-binding protein
MKLFFTAIFTALVLTACASNPNQTPAEAAAARLERIQTACVVDAGIRPIVDQMMNTYGFNGPEEIATIQAARAIIDPICANPSGDVSVNVATAFFGASTQIFLIYTQYQVAHAEEVAKAKAAETAK